MSKLSSLINKFFHVLNKPTKKSLNSDSEIQMEHSKIEDYIHPIPEKIFRETSNKIIFHTYWKGQFGQKQAFSIKSLIATQKQYEFEIWLWLDYEDKEINRSNKYIEDLKGFLQIKYYDVKTSIQNHPFKKVYNLFDEHKNLAFRADGVRMWALSEYGGVWFDLDIMFIKDMHEFFIGPEFVYSWEKQNYANNALIYLRKNSETNKYLVKKVIKKHSTQPWALFNYKDKKLNSFKVYPASLFDPLWGIQNENLYIIKNFEEFFDKPIHKKITPSEAFPYAYAYHWHNLWKKEVVEGSLFSQFENYFENEIYRNSI